jgi:hypothetical protein
MKYKHIISIFLLGILTYLFGAWSKLTHQAFAENTLLAGFCTMMLSAVLAIIKILTTKNKDSFLNK